MIKWIKRMLELHRKRKTCYFRTRPYFHPPCKYPNAEECKWCRYKKINTLAKEAKWDAKTSS